MNITTVNPATDQDLETYEVHDADRVAAAIEMSDAQHRMWKKESFSVRSAALHASADMLEERADALAELMANEMGKPVRAGRGEVEKCAWACRHYADHAEEYLADISIDTENSKSYAHHSPLGVILAVMPWNFPLWQVVRFAAPAIMAGNGALLKHATSVTGSALALDEIFNHDQLPEGLFRTLVVPSSRVAGILEHPLVRAVTVTGSGPAGSAVASKAGELLKKSVLELGGSDPYVILEDANLEQAAATCANSRMINGGQSCISAKRFIVDDAVHDAFLELLTENMTSKVMGDPHLETTDFGPQARKDLRDELHDQVERSVAAGARLVAGGEIPDQEGAWYPATILADVAPGAPAYVEETFGPVAAVIRAAGEEEAIRIANDTDFGLGAAVFTEDVERGERIAAEELEAGNCFVNALVASDPRLPFGGIKQSGFGRELSDLGIKEFVNIKTVVVA
ncbi:MAG: NAD-dependent succinate-semialdehyde dehydrogenase, partial [Acidimicrobiia bacterium]|nr:NAD-dependent succinate-semialdehyde dehydrogenase [Acidimicrobiia bacterium]NNL28857.1 NAD-dependent succinate-semialdehyde dehydrogenase [Acidimicrobiia bacterium]